MPEISVRVPVTYNAEWQDGYGARVLVRIDARAISENWHEAHGEFALSDRRCVLEIYIPYPLQLDTHYP
jgi:hypothetical protein